MNAKRKVSDILSDLQRVGPKRSRYGQLYRLQSETQGSWNTITLYTLFRSSDGDVMMRPHIFTKSRVLSGAEWDAWFRDHPDPRTPPKYPDGRGSLSRILRDNVLPGIELKTGNTMQWQVLRIIGWRPNAVPKSGNDAKRRGRNQKKSPRKPRG